MSRENRDEGGHIIILKSPGEDHEGEGGGNLLGFEKGGREKKKIGNMTHY